MPRWREPRDPVTVHLDGESITAERGEPVAAALVASGRWVLARSPKYHRPRGPTCLRGGCDGCFARVDGIPNVMTCRRGADEGMRIERQNVLGRGEADLLRVTDWLFPSGLNHHELMAGIPGARSFVPALARRIAGIGRLPSKGAPGPLGGVGATAREIRDVLVIGAGPSGMASALELARRGRDVEVIDADRAPGGCLAALPGAAADAWRPLMDGFLRAVADPRSRIRLRLETTAAGIYGDDVLVVAGSSLTVVQAKTLVLAPGAHDGVLPFEGNDLPGVVTARAAGRLLGLGIAVGDRVVVVGADVESPFGRAFATAYAAEAAGRLRSAAPARARSTPPSGSRSQRPQVVFLEAAAETTIRVTGGRRVREIAVGGPGAPRRFRCDALVVDAPRSAAYELCVQAGAEVALARPRNGGFVVRTTEGGQIRAGVLGAGEAVGTPLKPDAVFAAAAALRS